MLTKLNLDGFELNLPQLRGTEPVEVLDLLDLSFKDLDVASGIVIASLIRLAITSSRRRPPSAAMLSLRGALRKPVASS